LPTLQRPTLLLLALLVSAHAHAQTPFELTVDYQRQRDRFAYRFENPSSFDTAELVPHFFEQRYTGDNHWLRARAAYRIGSLALVTIVAAAPPITTSGDDLDTFFQPTGDVVVSGTTGNVTLQSWRVDQRLYVPAGARLGVHVGYGYRRDRARFHAGNKLVSHTLPPSIERSIVTTRETTWSDVHEMRLGIERSASGGPWRLTATAHAAPGVARLTVQLPDKYPGIDLRFPAGIVSGGAALSVDRAVAAVIVRAGIEYARVWSFREESALRRDTLGMHVGIGWRH
jgi:hypothetical protein